MRNAWLGSICLLFVVQYCSRYRALDFIPPEGVMHFNQVDYRTQVRDSLAAHPETKSFTCIDCGLTEIPPELLACKDLEHLSLGNNQLTVLPPETNQWSQLKTIDLSNNPGLGFPLGLTKLKQLRTITLYQTNLRTLPEEISQLTILNILNIGQNPILPEGLNVLKNRVSIQALDLSYCNLSEVPKVLTTISSLRRLDLTGNSIQSLPPSFFDLDLASLSLDENKFFRISEDFKKFNGKLNYLSLGGNPINAGAIEELREWLPDCMVEFYRE